MASKTTNKFSPEVRAVRFASDVLQLIWRIIWSMERLRVALLDGTYRPTPVKQIHIPKASGKLRPLGIPILLDRIVQRAMLMAMEPIWGERLPLWFLRLSS